MQKQLRWLGQMKRMSDSRIHKTVLCTETRDGFRKQGCPLLRYSDNCKADMKLFEMNVESLKQSAIQRSLRKEDVTKGGQRYEQALVPRSEVNGHKRKQLRSSQDANDDDGFICEQCNKRCRSRIGLCNHLQNHLN